MYVLWHEASSFHEQAQFRTVVQLQECRSPPPPPSPVILKHELSRLRRRPVAEVDLAEGLHGVVAPVGVRHVGERVHDPHGKGEREAENPDEHNYDL